MARQFFGTDGVRGTVGEAPITPDFVLLLGQAAATENDFGSGKAYYICADAEQKFYDDLYAGIVAEAGIRKVFSGEIPEGIAVSVRTDAENEYIFIQNYNPQPTAFLPEMEDAELMLGELTGEMKPFSTAVLKRKKR